MFATRTTHRLLALVIISTSLLGERLAADVGFSKRDAERLTQKLGNIGRLAIDQRARDRRTVVTEDEINAYFTYRIAEVLPQGLRNPRILMLGDGRVVAHALLDLNQLRGRDQGSAAETLRGVSSEVPVSITGTLRTGDGVGRFDLESVDVSGVPVPKSMVQQFLTYYSRSRTRPTGLNLDESFTLPANIRRIEVARGQALIVQ